LIIHEVRNDEKQQDENKNFYSDNFTF